MIRRPPRSTRTDTLFPYTTLFRSQVVPLGGAGPGYREVRLARRAGHDVVEPEAAARLQHPGDLPVEARLVGDVHGGVLSPHQVEGRRGEGQVERVGAEEAGLPFEAHALAEFLRHLAVDLGQVEADHLAAKLAGEPARRPTDAAAKLEQQLASLRVEALRQLGGRL